MKTLPSTDVVIIGGGWTACSWPRNLARARRTRSWCSSAAACASRRTTSWDMDELDYFVRLHMMQDPSQETVTVRHDPSERALPIRQFANFLPGSGVGGTGEHWGAQVPRFQPDCFELYSKTVARYGEKKLPEDHAIQDWGITYDEMEPYLHARRAHAGHFRQSRKYSREEN